MIDYIKKIIYDVILYRRSDIESTRIFKNLKHNSDLCPITQRKLEKIIYDFKKYRTITYDIQGFKDEGTDNVIRLSNEDDIKYVCFQIKSNDDIKDKDYLTKLKAQLADSQNSYANNLLDYYIFLCCDLTDKSSKTSITNKIRQIEAAFNKIPFVHVIEPQYVRTFIKLSSAQIDALIKRKISEEDIVLEQAESIIIDLTPTERAVLYLLVWKRFYEEQEYISFEDIVNSNFLFEVYNMTSDYERDWFFIDDEEDSSMRSEEEDDEDEDDSMWFEEDYKYEIRDRDYKSRVLDDLEYLNHKFINYIGENKYLIKYERVYPLLVLMLEAHIRYDYTQSELLFYMMNLFGTMRGFEIDDNKSEFSF